MSSFNTKNREGILARADDADCFPYDIFSFNTESTKAVTQGTQRGFHRYTRAKCELERTEFTNLCSLEIKKITNLRSLNISCISAVLL